MITRRHALLGAAATAGASAASLLDWARAWAQESPFKPEPGASLTFLRWAPFLEAEGRTTAENIRAFTQATGVEVKIEQVWQDDVHSAVSVAASVGRGPDLAWVLHTTPHQFPDKLLDLGDVAGHVGAKYGGWYPLIEQYGRSEGRWIGVPIVCIGVLPNYRVSTLKEAGFDRFPGDTDGFLRLCEAMAKLGKPAGFAVGRAPSDANSFCHWLLWSHGGRLVDDANRVAINSPETLRALDYARALYATFIPGTASWNDASNNAAFLAGQLHLTNNAVSIYGKARADKSPIADDMDHALWPVGPVGQPTELHLVWPVIAFRYTRYPQAARALLTFLLERQQYERVLENSLGYVSQSLRAYESSPVWQRDPKVSAFKNVAARGRPISWPGTLGEASTNALAEFIVIDMVTEAVSGSGSVKDAAASAERRARRIYRQG